MFVINIQFYSQFYFTPLGTYCTEVFLYFVYLGLFTYLSILQFRVYDAMSTEEFIFWVFNAGYVTNELQSIFANGVKQYFGDTQNYFDTLISFIFVASICLRLYAIYNGVPCVTPAIDCSMSVASLCLCPLRARATAVCMCVYPCTRTYAHTNFM